MPNFTGIGGTYTYSIIETPGIIGIDPANINDYFIVVDSDRKIIKSASFSYSDSKINLTIAVPEPATCAALLGALAIGLAALHKRRG